MFQKWDSPGFFVKCDKSGNILELIHSAPELPFRLLENGNMLDCCDPGSREKLIILFTSVLEKGAVYNYEVAMTGNVDVSVMSLNAILKKEVIYLTGSEIPAGVTKIFEELMLINNDQIKTIRQLSKLVFQLKGKMQHMRRNHIERFERLATLSNKNEDLNEGNTDLG